MMRCQQHHENDKTLVPSALEPAYTKIPCVESRGSVKLPIVWDQNRARLLLTLLAPVLCEPLPL